MHKIKCSKCEELAHILVNQTPYCLDCVPLPIITKRLPTNQTTQKNKPWYKKVTAFLDDRRPK